MEVYRLGVCDPRILHLHTPAHPSRNYKSITYGQPCSRTTAGYTYHNSLVGRFYLLGQLLGLGNGMKELTLEHLPGIFNNRPIKLCTCMPEFFYFQLVFDLGELLFYALAPIPHPHDASL